MVTHRGDAYFAATTEAELTARLRTRNTLTAPARASAVFNPPGGFSIFDPYNLAGVGGTVEVPAMGEARVSPTAWLWFQPSFSGALTMRVSDPTGWKSWFDVYDEDFGQLQFDDDNELTVVLTAGQRVRIAVSPAPDEANYQAALRVTWSYARRASSQIRVTLERDRVNETPGAMAIDVGNGYPNDRVTFSVFGPTVAEDIASTRLNRFGSLEDFAITLPALDKGLYLLRTESANAGSEEVEFRVLNDALSWGTRSDADPEPPTPPEVRRWTFYDLRDPDQRWTLARNPASWTNMHPPNDFTHGTTTHGQPLTWQAGSRPWRMEFTGYLDDQAEYERFAFWTELRRRLWLIDHRNRAWLVTLEHFDAQARIEPGKPWAHDYTVRALIFKQATD